MRRRHATAIALFLCLLAPLIGSSAPLSARARARPVRRSLETAPKGSSLSQVVETYCAGCHNGRMQSPGGIVLDRFDPTPLVASCRLAIGGRLATRGHRSRQWRATSYRALAAIEEALGAHGDVASVAASPRSIATRLAALLWYTAADDRLMAELNTGRRDAVALEQQVRRMLADKRAGAFVARFFFPWLELDTLGRADPDRSTSRSTTTPCVMALPERPSCFS